MNYNVDCPNIKNTMHTPHRGGRTKAIKSYSTALPPNELQPVNSDDDVFATTGGKSMYQQMRQSLAAQ